MAIINQRWPRDLSPETCVFTRSRNDIRQEAPLSRRNTIIRQGRPLWEAQLSWSLPNTDRLAQLRYWLDSLDGYNGSAQIWDFSSWRPEGLPLATTDAEGTRIFWTYLANRAPFSWAGMPSHWQLNSTVTATVAAAQGATSFTTGGFTAGVLVALQGQYVQVGRRLYVVASGVTANGSGVATVPLTTPLLAALTVGETLRFAEAACEMELIEQSFSASASAGTGFVSVAATFRETVTDKI